MYSQARLSVLALAMLACLAALLPSIVTAFIAAFDLL